MTAPRPRPTPIAAPRLRPARPLEGGDTGCSVTGRSAVAGAGGAGTAACRPLRGPPVGGGAGRAPAIGIGPVSSARSVRTAGSSTLPGSGEPGRRAGGGVIAGDGRAGSDLEQLGLLVLDRRVDVPDVLGREVVELLLRAAHLVLARLAVLRDA